MLRTGLVIPTICSFPLVDIDAWTRFLNPQGYAIYSGANPTQPLVEWLMVDNQRESAIEQRHRSPPVPKNRRKFLRSHLCARIMSLRTNHVHWAWNVLIEQETSSLIGLSPIKFDYISDFVLIWLHPLPRPLPHSRPHSLPHSRPHSPHSRPHSPSSRFSYIGGTHFSYNHASDVDRTTVWLRRTLRAASYGWRRLGNGLAGMHSARHHTADIYRATVWLRLTLRATLCGWHGSGNTREWHYVADIDRTTLRATLCDWHGSGNGLVETHSRTTSCSWPGLGNSLAEMYSASNIMRLM